MAGAAVVVGVPARVTFDDAPRAVDELWRALQGHEAAVLDLAGCREFDSSLIGVLLELMRRAGAAGARLSLRNPSANLRKLAGLYGIEELLLVDRD